MAGGALTLALRRAASGVALFVMLTLAGALRAAAIDDAPPATMRVGAQRAITTFAEAARRARDGEVIEIDAGEYHAPSAVWTQNELIIRGPRGPRGPHGMSGRVVLHADGASAEGKAIWVVRGGRVRIEDVEFRGARVASGNGAGIRFERGELILERCAFFDNEMGILTAASEQMSLVIRDSAFGAAPRHPGLLHHLLYVGAIGRFELVGSRLGNGYLGHLVKSRARENHVRYNVLVDGDDGRASYELEFPDGGLAYVVGNVIGQSRRSDNPAVVAYGAESARWERNGLYLAHNTLINELPSGLPVKIWERHFPGGVDTWLINNLIVGQGRLPSPSPGRSVGNSAVDSGQLVAADGLPWNLDGASPLRASLAAPGSVHGVDLAPVEQFAFPLGRRARRDSGALSPGALP